MSFARAFAALTGASAISMLAQLIRGKLAALFLGPAGVGIFNQLSLVWNIAQTVGGLGSFNGLIQHGAEALGKDDQVALRRLTSTFTLLLGVVSLLIALGGAVFAAPLSDWLLHDGGKHAPLLALLMLAVPVGVSAQLWRALLSAGQQVSSLVRAQIAADLISAAIFAFLVMRFGLTGAVIGFLASQLILFLVQGWYVRKKLGPELLRPRLNRFDWSIVRSNLGFGASGLLLIVLVNLGVLMVSQMLIGQLGPEANGFFANAWRIASIYLGAVTATTIGYFVPALTRTPDNAAMGCEVNRVLGFYLVLLPPIMAMLMACGEVLVWLILSSKFMPVAALLLVFVPAELLRIASESILAQFLARRRLASYSLLYVVQFGVLVGGAAVLIPRLGLDGAALAYGLAMVASLLLALVLSYRAFGFLPNHTTVSAGIAALLLLGTVATLTAQFPPGAARLAWNAAAVTLWAVVILANSERRALLVGVLARVRSRGGAA